MSNKELIEIGKYILLQTQISSADIAFVFGSPHSNEIFSGHICELWKRGLFKKLVLSGGGVIKGGAQKESLYLKHLLIEKGIPEHIILTEEQSKNTGDNVKFAMPIFERLVKEGYSLDPILSIGKVFAARRCLMTLQKYIPDSRKMFSSINTFGVPVSKWFTSEELKEKVLSEYRKIPQYLSEGYIVELPSEIIYRQKPGINRPKI